MSSSFTAIEIWLIGIRGVFSVPHSSSGNGFTAALIGSTLVITTRNMLLSARKSSVYQLVIHVLSFLPVRDWRNGNQKHTPDLAAPP